MAAPPSAITPSSRLMWCVPPGNRRLHNSLRLRARAKQGQAAAGGRQAGGRLPRGALCGQRRFRLLGGLSVLFGDHLLLSRVVHSVMLGGGDSRRRRA